MRGHQQVDHTADVALEIWADSEAELLDEAAQGVVEILTDGARVEAQGSRHVALHALDGEDRLVQFLNEVLVLAVTEGYLAARCAVTLGPDGRLEAELLGEERGGHKIQTELKSVTYHALSLSHDERGWRAFVVIDV